MSVNENEPVKCKDCSTWWRGLEHKCDTKVYEFFNNLEVDMSIVPRGDAKSKDFKKDHKEKKGCPSCGATGVHGCPGPRKTYTYSCHLCGKTVDYRYSHYCQAQSKY